MSSPSSHGLQQVPSCRQGSWIKFGHCPRIAIDSVCLPGPLVSISVSYLYLDRSSTDNMHMRDLVSPTFKAWPVSPWTTIAVGRQLSCPRIGSCFLKQVCCHHPLPAGSQIGCRHAAWSRIFLHAGFTCLSIMPIRDNIGVCNASASPLIC